MEKKKVVPVWVSVVLIILSVCTIAYLAWYTASCVYFGLAIVTNALLCLALIDAMFYCLKGYQKNDAVYFNLFPVLLLVATGLNTFNMFYHAVYTGALVPDTISIALILIAFSALSVLSFAKDLGKKKSYRFASIVIAATALNTVAQIFIAPEAILCAFGAVVASVIFFIMVYAKYQDKAARGAK